MIPANDILARANQIKDFVARGELDESLKHLIDFARGFLPGKENDAVSLSSRYSNLKRNEYSNLIAHADATLERSKITNAILEFVDEIIKELGTKLVGNTNQSVIGNIVQLEILLAEELRKREVPNDIVLEAKNIKKLYPNSRFTFELNHLELRLGKITGVVGENATGKTTLFRILAGDLKHDSGELHYPLFQKSRRLNWIQLKQQIAYVPQELPKWNGSLWENLKYEAALHGVKGEENEKAVNYIIERLGLSMHVDKSWQQLSGGYKLRFSLAKALIWNPKLLILDEPLAFLDVKTQMIVLNDMMNLTKSFNYPLSVIINSQHLHEIEAVADQMLYIDDGKVEHLGNMIDYGNNRLHNTFELNCSLSHSELSNTLKDFPHQKIWSNGMTYFVTTDLEVSGYDLLQYLAEKNVSVRYYRDISQSVKTKFYE